MSESSDVARGRGPQTGGLLAIVGWIAVGALLLGALMLAVDRAVGLPLSRAVAVGLGLALGGGLGGLANLLQGGERPTTSDETVAVAPEPTTPDPQPADLFDGHPDPVLYYADEDHGPMVLAANDAFGETFDVPPDRLPGTPLSEAMLVTGDQTVGAEAVTAGGLDGVVRCETSDGGGRFRLRTVQRDDIGYLLYTPVE